MMNYQEMYEELRAAQGTPVIKGVCHQSALIQATFLHTKVCKAANADRMLDALKAGGVRIPCTAPVAVLDGDDGSERDEPAPDENEALMLRVELANARAAIQRLSAQLQLRATPEAEAWRTAATYVKRWEDMPTVPGYYQIVRADALFGSVEMLCHNPDSRELEWWQVAGEEGAWTPEQKFVETKGATFTRLDILFPDGRCPCGEPSCTPGAKVPLWTDSVTTDSVLDDPRMNGNQWNYSRNVTQQMLDAWPVWEAVTQDGQRSPPMAKLTLDQDDDFLAWRPLRLPGMGPDGIVSSECMLEHRGRCSWQWREPAWFTNWRDDAEVKCNVMRAMGDQTNGRIEWRPAGWPDGDDGPDYTATKAAIAEADRHMHPNGRRDESGRDVLLDELRRLMPLRDALNSGSEVSERLHGIDMALDALMVKYDLVPRIEALEATRANEQAIAVGVDALGARVAGLEKQLTDVLGRFGRLHAGRVTWKRVKAHNVPLDVDAYHYPHVAAGAMQRSAATHGGVLHFTREDGEGRNVAWANDMYIQVTESAEPSPAASDETRTRPETPE